MLSDKRKQERNITFRLASWYVSTRRLNHGTARKASIHGTWTNEALSSVTVAAAVTVSDFWNFNGNVLIA